MFSGGLWIVPQILAVTFLGKVPAYWCQVQELIDANWTAQQIKAFTNQSE